MRGTIGSGAPKDEAGVPLIANQPRHGSEAQFITHNYADRTTWWGDSFRVTDEELTDSGDGLTWSSAHINWIDLTHGKVSNEDDVSGDYLVAVKVDSIPKTEREPFADSGGDYTVDYDAGTITFMSSQAGKTVEVSYSYENGSTWYMVPTAGKKILIEKAEVQFSANCQYNDTIDFEVWAYNPADLPNKVKYSSTSYKTMRNMIDDAIGSFPVVPAIGGAQRGTGQPTYGFPFYYAAVRVLDSVVGAELRIKLRDDQVFGGEFATATFYCMSEDSE